MAGVFGWSANDLKMSHVILQWLQPYMPKNVEWHQLNHLKLKLCLSLPRFGLYLGLTLGAAADKKYMLDPLDTNGRQIVLRLCHKCHGWGSEHNLWAPMGKTYMLDPLDTNGRQIVLRVNNCVCEGHNSCSNGLNRWIDVPWTPTLKIEASWKLTFWFTANRLISMDNFVCTQ